MRIQLEYRTPEGKMVGWHHRREFKQALGDGEGQGSLACCSPWGRKESDWATEQQTLSYFISLFLQLFFSNFHLIHQFITHNTHSVQFSRLVVSDSLWPHESQHARPSCPSPTPGVHSDSSPSSQWCHPAISSSVVLFSSCPQSLAASESFPMSQLFAWGGQSTGVSASASFLPNKSQGWSSEWTGWISLQFKGLLRVFSNSTVQKHQFFGARPSSQSNSHLHTWPLEKP